MGNQCHSQWWQESFGQIAKPFRTMTSSGLLARGRRQRLNPHHDQGVQESLILRIRKIVNKRLSPHWAHGEGPMTTQK